jgi:hypothetical protein
VADERLVELAERMATALEDLAAAAAEPARVIHVDERDLPHPLACPGECGGSGHVELDGRPVPCPFQDAAGV